MGSNKESKGDIGNVIKYMDDINIRLNSINNREEQELLVTNVLEEIKSYLVPLAKSNESSNVLETLIRHASLPQLENLLVEYLCEFSLLDDMFGSRVLQQLINVTARWITIVSPSNESIFCRKKYNDNNRMDYVDTGFGDTINQNDEIYNNNDHRNICLNKTSNDGLDVEPNKSITERGDRILRKIETYVTEIADDLSYLGSQKNSTHVIRALTHMIFPQLHGRQIYPEPKLESKLQELQTLYVKSLLEDGKLNFFTVARNQYLSPVIQLVLQAKSPNIFYMIQEFLDLCKTSPGTIISTSKNCVGSRTIDTILEVLADRDYSGLSDTDMTPIYFVFHGRHMDLLKDKYGQFITAKIVKLMNDVEEFNLFINEINSVLKNMVKNHRLNIVYICIERYIYFHKKGESSKLQMTLIEFISICSTINTSKESSLSISNLKSDESLMQENAYVRLLKWFLNPYGTKKNPHYVPQLCKSLSVILSYPELELSVSLATALTCLKPNDLTSMAMDLHGSWILTSLVQEHSQDIIVKIVTKCLLTRVMEVRPTLTDVACSKSGSILIRQMYNRTSRHYQKLIHRDLLSNYLDLHKTKYGKDVIDQLSLQDHFKSHKKRTDRKGTSHKDRSYKMRKSQSKSKDGSRSSAIVRFKGKR